MKLGLPDGTRACLFDMDGVLTDTASVHAAAWKQMFDEFLGPEREPFDIHRDYDDYVDGKPREDGTRSFLVSRGIEVDEVTITLLSDRKNALVQEKITELGVKVFDGSVAYVRAATAAGLKTAVVSASANTHQVLAAAGIDDLFHVVIDGIVAKRRALAGKPAPDTYLAAAHDLGVEPGAVAVFEDAQAGVAAGRAGGFHPVVGVDRVGQADELRRHGAHLVVKDLSELLEPS